MYNGIGLVSLPTGVPMMRMVSGLHDIGYINSCTLAGILDAEVSEVPNACACCCS